MKLGRRSVAGALVWAALVAPRTGFAQADTPSGGDVAPDDAPTELPASDDGGRSDDDDDEARAFYALGDRRYAEGDYEGAIVAFEKALALSRRQELHFSIANAQERLHDLRGALASLARYLEVAPAEGRATIKLRMESIQRRIAAEPLPAEAPTCPDEAGPPTPSPAAVAPTSGIYDAVGYTILGVGGASLVAAAILGGVALAARAEAEEACVGGLCSEAAESALDRDHLLSGAADVALGLGAAGVLAGGLIVLLGPSAPADVAVAVGTEGGVLRWQGTF